MKNESSVAPWCNRSNINRFDSVNTFFVINKKKVSADNFPARSDTFLMSLSHIEIFSLNFTSIDFSDWKLQEAHERGCQVGHKDLILIKCWSAQAERSQQREERGKISSLRSCDVWQFSAPTCDKWMENERKWVAVTIVTEDSRACCGYWWTKEM